MSDHCLPLSSNWLTDSLLFRRTDWCDPGVWRCQGHISQFSKFVKVVTVSEVDDEDRVDSILVEILTLKIVQNIEAEVWSRFWDWSSVEILKLKCGQDFEGKVWSRFTGHRLVNILSQTFGRYLEAEVWWRFWSWIVTNLLHNLKAFIPLCLWKCLDTYPHFQRINFCWWDLGINWRICSTRKMKSAHESETN